MRKEESKKNECQRESVYLDVTQEGGMAGCDYKDKSLHSLKTSSTETHPAERALPPLTARNNDG